MRPHFPYTRWNHSSLSLAEMNLTAHENASFSLDGANVDICGCLGQLQHLCVKLREPLPATNLQYNSDVGRMCYTIAILSLFAMVILLLMIRSIRRSSSTMEIEALLDSMRYREELDNQQRQKRRLQKAKNKVTAWLTRTNGKMWNSSPQIIVPNGANYAAKPQRVGKGIRNDSMQSTASGVSYLPEIVISNSDDVHLHKRQNSYTPSLSLLYDFDARSRKNSNFSETSDTIDFSQFSDVSFPENGCLDPHFSSSP
ncbi:Protein MPS-1 [Aphelenchoides fujianensis]|nr:Protein MPS-1 [Aphelenchoides fujianensis]